MQNLIMATQAKKRPTPSPKPKTGVKNIPFKMSVWWGLSPTISSQIQKL